jgi:hypothetical protein
MSKEENIINILTEFNVLIRLFKLIRIYLDQSNVKVCIDKHLSEALLIHSDPKQDALFVFLFNSAL